MAQSFDIASIDTTEKAAAFLGEVMTEKQAITNMQGAMYGGGAGLVLAAIQAALNKKKRKHWLRNALLYGGLGAGFGAAAPTVGKWVGDIAGRGSSQQQQERATAQEQLDADRASVEDSIAKIRGHRYPENPADAVKRDGAYYKHVKQWQAQNPNKIYPGEQTGPEFAQDNAIAAGTGAGVGAAAGYNWRPGGNAMRQHIADNPGRLGDVTRNQVKAMGKGNIHPSLTTSKTTGGGGPMGFGGGSNPSTTKTKVVKNPGEVMKNTISADSAPGNYKRFSGKGQPFASTSIPKPTIDTYRRELMRKGRKGRTALGAGIGLFGAPALKTFFDRQVVPSVTQ